MIFLAEVFNNIRAECARKHITISELTEKANITRKTFYNWEDKGDMPTSALVRIAETLSVTTDKLLGI